MGIATGVFQSPNGSAVANGLWQWKLSSDAVQVSTAICNCPTLIRGNLDSHGAMTATFVFNDDLLVLTGLTTIYQLTIKDVNGGQVWNESYYLTGTAANINLLPPGGTGTITVTPFNYLLLETNGTANGSQTKLNLVAGSNVTVTDDGVGDVTIASTASGGGGIYPTMTQPLAANFTGLNLMGATFVDKTSRLVVTLADSNPNVEAVGLFQNLPFAAPYTLTLGISAAGATGTGNAYICYAGLRESVGAFWAGCGMLVQASSGPVIQVAAVRDRWSADGAAFTNRDTSTGISLGTSALFWNRIVDNGTNRLYYFSVNGHDWVLFRTESNTADLVADQVGMIFYNNNGVGIPAQFSVFDYQIVNSALSPIGA